MGHIREGGGGCQGPQDPAEARERVVQLERDVAGDNHRLLLVLAACTLNRGPGDEAEQAPQRYDDRQGKDGEMDPDGARGDL